MPIEPARILVDEVLQEITKKKRKSLLGFCIILVATIKGGVVPSKIPALGIELTPTNQNSLLILIGWIVAYFLIGFIIYSISDYVAWRVKFLSSVSEYYYEKGEISGETAQGKIVAPGHDDSKIGNFIKPVGNIRLIFDILLPIMVGLYSIIILTQNS